MHHASSPTMLEFVWIRYFYLTARVSDLTNNKHFQLHKLFNFIKISMADFPFSSLKIGEKNIVFRKIDVPDQSNVDLAV